MGGGGRAGDTRVRVGVAGPIGDEYWDSERVEKVCCDEHRQPMGRSSVAGRDGQIKIWSCGRRHMSHVAPMLVMGREGR